MTVEQRRRLRTYLIAATLLIGPFGCCGSVLAFLDHPYFDRPRNGIRVEHLEKDLNERLPLGSTWEEAEAWFDSHGIKPGNIGWPNEKRVGLAATIPNDSFVNNAEIRIALYFNAQGRLEKRVIYRFIYFL